MSTRKLMMDTIADLRQGMKLICPDSSINVSFVIDQLTFFTVNRYGIWTVQCGVCGKWHSLPSVYYLYEENKK